MLRVGIDLVQVSRIRHAIERQGERFLLRIFTDEEREYCQKKKFPWPNYAVRFAAKEALFKSLLPETLPTLVWKEIGVVRHSSGAPSLIFSGSTQELLLEWKFTLSLTHTHENAMAQVLASPPVT